MAETVTIDGYSFNRRPIGKGSFSTVYGGVDGEGQHVAIKVDTSKIVGGVRSMRMVEYETAVLNELQGIPGVPRVLWHGTVHIHGPEEAAFVTTLFECTVTEWLDKLWERGHKMTMAKAVAFTTCILNTLEDIHARGYVHRDLKPDNIMLGKPPDDMIYIVDYGLSKKVMETIDGESVHIPFKENKSTIVCTPRYCSTYTHEHVQSSRRDDLQSLLFIFLYLYFKKLPWEARTQTKTKEERQAEILQRKKEFLLGYSSSKTYSVFLNQFDPRFFEVTQYIYNLGYDEDPDYDYIRRGLKAAFRKNV
jgi:serine/threonine protein kinase